MLDLPSPLKRILEQAYENISERSSQPHSLYLRIFLRKLISLPASLNIRCIAATRNPPVPQQGSYTMSVVVSSPKSQNSSVICDGVKTNPDFCSLAA